MTDDAESLPEDKPSKSQKKRDMLALQDLAMQLSTFSNGELTRLGLSAAAIGALAAVRPMRASGAKQRQIKYAAKLLAKEDIARPELLLAGRREAQAEANKQFHVLEYWRDRLVEQGDSALSELLDKHPNLDRQQLRQLIRSAQKERDLEKPPSSARRLFKLLREGLTETDTY